MYGLLIGFAEEPCSARKPGCYPPGGVPYEGGNQNVYFEWPVAGNDSLSADLDILVRLALGSPIARLRAQVAELGEYSTTLESSS